MSKKINDKWLIFGIIILAGYILFRLVDQAQLIHTFPLDYTNDWSSYMAQLHFLKDCGFHNYCSYWYNGFTSFLSTAPGWFFFTLPLYLLFNNVNLAAYISLILLMFLSSLGIYFIGKELKLTKIQVLFTILFFFGNPITLGNFIRLGRTVSIFAFTIGIWITYLCLHYKDKKIDKGFLLFIPLTTILIISHYQEAVLFSLIPLGLLLYKKNNWERIIIIASGILGIILSLFWLYPFLNKFFTTSMSTNLQGQWILDFSTALLPTQIASFIIPLALILTFVLYNQKRDILFFGPILFVLTLFMLRITAFIPIFSSISPDPFITVAILFTLLLFFKIEWNSKLLKTIAIIFLLLAPIASVAISHTNTPYFIEYTEVETDTLQVLKETTGNYLLFIPSEFKTTSYDKAYYSYTAIEHGLTTASGWYPHIVTDETLFILNDLRRSAHEDCNQFTQDATFLQIEQVVGYGEFCQAFNNCNLEVTYEYNNACVYTL